MTHVSVAGTFSCSQISIGNFKGWKDRNEEYKAKKNKTPKPANELSVDQFYTKILYPVAQPLGKTYDMPLRELMEHVDAGPLKTKLVTAMLNHTQYMQDGNYWPKELNELGFKLVAKTKNAIGGAINYLYIRNPAGVEIEEGEF